MIRRLLVIFAVVLGLFMVNIVATRAAVSAQAQAASETGKWTMPRTPDGQPDLQGIWTNSTLTPLERPANLAGKPYFTPQEAAEYEKRVLDQSNRDRRGKTAEEDVNRAYNEAWFDRGTKVVPTLRTSLVVDPPDGRVPALTPEAQKAEAARNTIFRKAPEGPEDLTPDVRCLLRQTAGPPMLPANYNNNYQILQVPGYVVILTEMIHDARIIPLGESQHLPANIRRWMGDPRGHWEGDTLVVDSTNFTNKTHFRGADENLHLVERFKRTGPNAILYQFTVDDPTAFTKSWAGELAFIKTEGPIFEYACHEGNYSMVDILRGARQQEQAEGRK
jgi:hypothetical protein